MRRPPAMVGVQASQAESQGDDESAVGDVGDREVVVFIQQKQDGCESGGKSCGSGSELHFGPGGSCLRRGKVAWHRALADSAITNCGEVHRGGIPKYVMGMHQDGRIGKQAIINPVSEGREWPPT